MQMPLFNKDMNIPPRRNSYSEGFEKVYKAWGKLCNKFEAYEEWKKQCLEEYADYIAVKAEKLSDYHKLKGRFQQDLRRWLRNGSWEEDVPTDEIQLETPRDACKAFKDGLWTHIDGVDMSKEDIRWNSTGLIISKKSIIRPQRIKHCRFTKPEV